MNRYPEHNDPLYYELHSEIDRLLERNAKLVAALEKARTYSGALNYMRAPEFIRLIDEALAQQSTEKS